MSDPEIPEPDGKDWTWTLDRRCPDCGFDAGSVHRQDVPRLTRRYAATLAEAATADGGTRRPAPAIWSASEYAAHVLDVCVLFGERLALMLTRDDPQFENWDQDKTALARRYWELDRSEVAAELAIAADAIAHAFGGVSGAQWGRPGRRSNGSVFTIDTLARYFLHDLAHHAWDVSAR